MAYSKVILNGTTLMDVTQDTVAADTLLSGETATAKSGTRVTGTVTVPTKTSDLVNDSGFITTETDPTVPAWAKASSKPSYTASEVGAVPTTRTVNGKALSADISLSASDVSALPASTPIPSKTSDLTNDSGFITGYTETDPTVPSWAKASSKPSYTASEVGAVPTSRKVNGKALSADISLSASDVGALPSSTSIPSKTSDLTNDSGYITGYTETDPTVPAWAKASSKPAYTATEVGAQPTLVSGTNIKTINNESLLGSGNITIQGGGSATAMTEAEIQAAFDEGWPTLTGYILTLSLVSPIHTSAAYTPCVTIDQYSSINVDEYGQYVDVIDGATIEVSDPTISNASFTLDPTAVAFTVAPQGTYPTQSPSWGVTCTGGVAQVGFSMGQNKFTITADGTLTISGIDYDND